MSSTTDTEQPTKIPNISKRKMNAQETLQKSPATTNAVEVQEKRSSLDDELTTDDHVYPGPWALASITLALYLTIFLVSLDRTIIATAIPRITNTFKQIDDIGWYGTAFILTSATFLLTFGRIYTFYSSKWVFLSALVIFEIGSAVCGAAPSSTSFIIGRAIAGLGTAELASGSFVLIAANVPLQKRPIYTGCLGAIFGLASVVAPLLGGALTDQISWRWCFYINLPIGALTILVILLVLKSPPPLHPSSAKTSRERFNQLDPIGAICLFAGIVCLVLALEWGGTIYSWHNTRIIVIFVLFGIILIMFVLVQRRMQETATVPPRLIKNRSIMAGFFFAFCTTSSMMVFIYYLPLWFQAVKGVTAIKSGIMGLPFILGLVSGSVAAGILVTRLGYYTPFMYACIVFMSVGGGLLTTFTASTNHRKWIGYQVLVGFGYGIGFQQPVIAVQTVLDKKDISTGISLIQLAPTLGGAVFLAVSETVFSNELLTNIRGLIPGQEGEETAVKVANAGATTFRDIIDPQFIQQVITAYNNAITKTFTIGLATSCIAIIGALAMGWDSVKKPQAEKKKAESEVRVAV